MSHYKERINRVIATGVSGKFKGQRIEVIFGKSYNDSKVLVDGKIVKGVLGVWIKCRAGEITKLTIEMVST